MTTQARRMRLLLEGDSIIASPGIYDGYSARLAAMAGFDTASTTGAGIANSRLGVADSGVMSMLENVDACRDMVRAVDIPIMADADTGYGNPVSVYTTVQRFEEAGVVGVNIEDQTFPKRCGHMAGKDLISAADMAMKITAATDARKDEDFVVCARTDAIAVTGLEDAVARVRAYEAAGADMVFPDAVRSAADIEALVSAVSIPVSINMGFGIRARPTTPLLSMRQLEDLGVKRVSLPRMLTAAAISGMVRTLELFRESMISGETVDRPDLLASIEDITELMGYSELNTLESRYSGQSDLARRYKDGKVERVRRS